jgi:hypothetical protein
VAAVWCERGRRCERGQATVEWVGLVLLAALALGVGARFGPSVDGRSFGGFLGHRIACAVKAGCEDGDAALARAYGKRDAGLVRRHAPGIVYEPGERQLPVDWRRCRARHCADGPDDRRLDAHRTHAGERATVFTHLVRHRGRTYLQYWLYYPDSNTTWAGASRAWERSYLLPRVGKALGHGSRWPGFHYDDWEGYQLRLEPDGDVWARATSHGHWQGCKQRGCRNRWVRGSGWTRVSRGSHAGHIPGRGSRPSRFRPLLPGRHLRERTSTSEGLRLIPLERIDRRRYRPLDDGIKPPWRKRAYRHPEDGSS